MERLKLYKITVAYELACDYDYLSAIVTAYDENQAKGIHPDNSGIPITENMKGRARWPKEKYQLNCDLLGYAAKGVEPGEVLMSKT